MSKSTKTKTMKLNQYFEVRPFGEGQEGQEGIFPNRTNIGIEIELENLVLPRRSREERERDRPDEIFVSPRGWVVDTDGSLRNNGIEFIFDKPQFGTEITNRLESLIRYIKEHKLKPECSPRTSVHVHVDAGELTIEQVFKWLLIYTVYEPLLFNVFAPTRINSNFCVPIFGSSFLKELVLELKSGSWKGFMPKLKRSLEHKRYAAVNLEALYKFRSLEFRHLAGEYKPKPIIDWVRTLLFLREWGTNPEKNIEALFHGPSKVYAENMTYQTFDGDIATRLITSPNFRSYYLQGVRTAQEIYLDTDIPPLPKKFLPIVEEAKKEKLKKKVRVLKNHIDGKLVDKPNVIFNEAENADLHRIQNEWNRVQNEWNEAAFDERVAITANAPLRRNRPRNPLRILTYDIAPLPERGATVGEAGRGEERVPVLRVNPDEPQE